MRHHRWRALLPAALAVGAGPASAHAFLQHASPAVGSTLQHPPGEVVIAFTEDIEPAFSTLAVTDAGAARVDTGATHLEHDARHLAVGLKPLRPGTYTVVWHATSVDTHRTQGSFSFTVAG